MLGFYTLVGSPKRLRKIAVITKPSMLLRLHRALVKPKYHLLFRSQRTRRPEPKGPSGELIAAVVEMKRRNPRMGCRKIAEQISCAFGLEIDIDVVQHILIQHYGPASGSDGPSWLSVIGQARDSLWSVDLFRCKSILLQSYWVMVVMDIFTRRIIGLGLIGSFHSRPRTLRPILIRLAASPEHFRLGFKALLDELVGVAARTGRSREWHSDQLWNGILPLATLRAQFEIQGFFSNVTGVGCRLLRDNCVILYAGLGERHQRRRNCTTAYAASRGAIG